MKHFVALTILVAAVAAPVRGTAYLFPYVLEGRGTATAGSVYPPIDSSFVLTSVDGLAGITSSTGGGFAVYLFDGNGSPIKSATAADVCNPCVRSFDTTTPRVEISLQEEFTLAGGFPATISVSSAVVDVYGPSADHARISLITRNATQFAFAGDADGDMASTPTDIFYLINALFAAGAPPLSAATEVHTVRLASAPYPAAGPTYLIPEITEKQGPTTSTQFTNDNIFYLLSAGGHVSIPAAGGATVDIYLYQNSGSAMLSGTGVPLCSPCSYNVAQGTRVQVKLEDRVQATGWGSLTSVSGFAIIRVSGPDPDSIAVTALEISSRTNALDLLIRELPKINVTP